MPLNPECAVCPIGDNAALCQLAGRIRGVYVSDAFDALPPDANMIVAEDEIHQREITPDDIGRLNARIEEDTDLSLTGCFVLLHEAARGDRETLSALVDEQTLALAGCATHRLRRTCKL